MYLTDYSKNSTLEETALGPQGFDELEDETDEKEEQVCASKLLRRDVPRVVPSAPRGVPAPIAHDTRISSILPHPNTNLAAFSLLVVLVALGRRDPEHHPPEPPAAQYERQRVARRCKHGGTRARDAGLAGRPIPARVMT